jgi:3-hydroxyisobutyrate dehydrogenase
MALRLASTTAARTLAAQATRQLSTAAAATTTTNPHYKISKCAFVGLGAMGFPMAANLCSKYEVTVWNRSHETAERHAESYGSHATQDLAVLADVDAVFMCLPTSKEVSEMVDRFVDHLRPGTFVVDCTSGHPIETAALSERLSAHSVGLIDCAVSGGPGGAKSGKLAAFVGGADEDVRRVVPALETFADNIVHLGPVSSGHAVKAINNAMNVSNLLCATEGLLCLKKMGIEPARALSVINKSSGRSLMSEKRIPQDVISGWFNYGFKLGLMRKDVEIANQLLDTHFPDASIMRNTRRLMDDALQRIDELDGDSDYTEVIRGLEALAGTDLRQNSWHWQRK